MTANMKNGYDVMPISPYPDEPHPDNEREWKKWWVNKMFKPDEPFSDWEWVDKCWKNTKAGWPSRKDEEKENQQANENEPTGPDKG